MIVHFLKKLCDLERNAFKRLYYGVIVFRWSKRIRNNLEVNSFNSSSILRKETYMQREELADYKNYKMIKS